jgi:acyl-CoA dehydrogenase
MRTVFSPEHDLFRDTVRRFVATEIVPYHRRWENDGIVPRELWLKAGEAGLLLCSISDEFGGGGGDFAHNAVVIEELARVNASGPGFSMQSDVAAPYIEQYGTEEQKRRWLPPMARGEIIAALGMTEPGTGSDVKAIRTSAVLRDGTYVINGQKTFITNGLNADLVILAVKTNPALGHRGVSLTRLGSLLKTPRSFFSKTRAFPRPIFSERKMRALVTSCTTCHRNVWSLRCGPLLRWKACWRIR